MVDNKSPQPGATTNKQEETKQNAMISDICGEEVGFCVTTTAWFLITTIFFFSLRVTPVVPDLRRAIAAISLE